MLPGRRYIYPLSKSCLLWHSTCMYLSNSPDPLLGTRFGYHNDLLLSSPKTEVRRNQNDRAFVVPVGSHGPRLLQPTTFASNPNELLSLICPTKVPIIACHPRAKYGLGCVATDRSRHLSIFYAGENVISLLRLYAIWGVARVHALWEAGGWCSLERWAKEDASSGQSSYF